MEDKRIRLVFFSAWGSDYKQFEFSLKSFLAILAGGAGALVVVFIFLLFGSKLLFQEIYTEYQGAKQNVLRRQFEQWQDRALELGRRYERLHGLPSGLIFTEVDKRNGGENAEALTGRGGAFVDEDDNILPTLQAGSQPDANLYSSHSLQQASTVDFNTLTPTDLINHLESRISATRQTHQTLFENFETRRQQLAHIPSVKPILSGRITDFFGKRVDPFVRRLRHHRGLDVAAPYGTTVYAPAAGTIELAKTTYRRGRGYGRVVIIDHGHGMKTLYGHLSKVNVKQGQRIQRWEIVGLVGDTGRATGPHLHYEVWADGKARDPVEFIINE
ncbi:M23 family metallopeptidase [candidate division KSB1 bacterium]|nr:M23 family metallopeptidase [candidate division KSB1 bacterium]